MLAVLPILALAIAMSVFRLRGWGWRASAMAGATGWGCVLVLITEGLSIGGHLTRASVATAWSVAIVGELTACLGSRRRVAPEKIIGCREADSGRELSPAWRTALVASVAVILSLIGVTALLSPPNTFDAMAYHLPRVVQWIQHHGVTFYPVEYLQQLLQPPGAEYLVLNLHVLAQGDRFDNLPQFAGFAGSVAGVSLIARFLGAGRSGQVLAAVLAATIPQGVLAASGAKNDAVLSFWLVSMCCALFMYSREPDRLRAGWAGASLGLSLLTKGTGYVYAPWLAMACFLCWPSRVRRGALSHLPLFLVVALSINLAAFARNAAFAGSPLVCTSVNYDGVFKFTNDRYDVATVVSNVIRNAALHLATPSQAVNDRVVRAVEALIRKLGREPNDPGSTWTSARFGIEAPSRHEDTMPNTVHVLLIVSAVSGLFWFLARSLAKRDTCPEWKAGPSGTVLFSAGCTCAFLAFCLVLRWQPWHTRLHLPLFLLWAAPLGAIVGRTWPRRVVQFLAALLIAGAVVLALTNRLRPLVGTESILARPRESLYFTGAASYAAAYRAIAGFVLSTGCRQVGFEPIPFEYPLLALLGAGSDDRVIVREIGVVNASAAVVPRGAEFRPCAVICFDCAGRPEKWKEYRLVGGRAWVYGPSMVFSAKGPIVIGERAFRLAVTFPKNPPNPVEPLLTFGRSQAGDFISVRYLPDRHIAFRFDHWGHPGFESHPVATQGGVEHTVEILVNPPEKMVRINFDGCEVLRHSTVFYPFTEDQITVGANLIGGTTMAIGFTGAIRLLGSGAPD